MPKSALDEIFLFMRGYKDHISRGECYQNGICVEQDLDVALDYFSQAAKQGHRQALTRAEQLLETLYDKELPCTVGDIYQNNLNNKRIASRCYKIAADRGY